MFHLTIIYFLVFTSLACFGYKKLEKYSEFQQKSEGGAVFQLAPDGEVKIKGVVGGQSAPVYDNVYVNLGSSDNHLHGRARMICVKYEKKFQTSAYNRLSFRYLEHGYEFDEVELDEFVVNACDKDNVKKMFEVTWIGTNMYAITFKDTNNACFKRDIEVIEDELTLIIRRKEPVPLECPESNESLRNLDGRVVPQSWIENGDFLDLDYKTLPKGSRFQMKGKLEDEPKESTFMTRVRVYENGQKFTIVNMFYKAIPIERLVAKTPLDFLDFSIVMEGPKKSKLNEVYINYMNTKGVCLRRKYEVSVQRVDGDDFLRHVTVKRSTPKKATCLALQLSCSTYRRLHNVEKEEEEDAKDR